MAQGKRSGATVSAIALFVILVAVYLVTGRGALRDSHEASLVAVAQSVVNRGQLDTNVMAWSRMDPQTAAAPGLVGLGGDVYARAPLAPAVAVLPFYLLGWLVPWLSMVQTSLWAGPVVTALTAVIVARLVYQLQGGLAGGVLAGAVYGLGTIAWPYAGLLPRQALAALALTGLTYALVRLRKAAGWRAALAGGFFGGILVASDLSYWLLLVPFACYLCFAAWHGDETNRRSWFRRLARTFAACLAFCLPSVYALAAISWYDWARLGTPLGAGLLPAPGTASPSGMLSLLVGSEQGFLWYTPLALGAILAWPGFLRRHGAEAWLVAAVSLVALWVAASSSATPTSGEWGPQGMLLLAPMVVVVLSPWLDPRTSPQRWAPPLLAILFSASLLVQLLAVGVDPGLASSLQLIPDRPSPRGTLGVMADWMDPRDGPLSAQVALLLRSDSQSSPIGWLGQAIPAWEVPLVALVTVLAAFSALLLARGQRRAVAALALVTSIGMLCGLALVSANVNDRSVRNVANWDHLRALGEASALGTTGSGIITSNPETLNGTLAHLRSTQPIYGMAQESAPLLPGTTELLWRASTRHTRLHYVTLGEPADEDAIAAWLSANAFPAGAQVTGAGLCDTYLTLSRLEPLEGAGRLGGGVTLVGTRAGPLSLHPGEGLAVELTWRLSPQSTATSLVTFIGLQTNDGRPVAELRDVATGGGNRSSQIEPGAEAIIRRGLILPTDLPRGEYRLVAGMYDAQHTHRLTVTEAGPGSGVDWIRLAAVDVQ